MKWFILYVHLTFLYLISGLRLAEQLGRREDEAKIRHGLGLSLWASGNLEEAQHQVNRGAPVPRGFSFQNHGRPWDYCLSSNDIGQKVLTSLLGLTYRISSLYQPRSTEHQ